MTELERKFNRAMVDIYHRAKREADYVATRYSQMLGDLGGLKTAKVLVNSERPSEGYTELWRRGKLGLTVEALVVENPEFHPLFEPAEIERARARLEDYSYIPR